MPYVDFLATGSFICPQNIEGPARIQAVGRGGNGAAGDAAGAAVAGGGGGGGAFSRRTIELIPGRTYTITIDNTASKFADSTNGSEFVLANKGGNASGATPGSGGSLSNAKGDIKNTGGDGGTGFTITGTIAGGGGGGEGGNRNGNGNAGGVGTETNVRAGAGGTSVPPIPNPNLPPGSDGFTPLFAAGFGNGNGANGGFGGLPSSPATDCTSVNGQAGASYGGGGGGGSANTSGPANGTAGNGGAGVVRVEYDLIFTG